MRNAATLIISEITQKTVAVAMDGFEFGYSFRRVVSQPIKPASPFSRENLFSMVRMYVAIC
jgi:hypothetical protein